MNCQPEDTAIITRIGGAPSVAHLIGLIVTVLYAAPIEEFHLPDGYFHEGIEADENKWVVEFQSPIIAPTSSGKSRATKYGVVPDWALTPIRDGLDSETMDELLELSL